MKTKKTAVLALAVVLLGLIAVAGARKPRGVPTIFAYDPGPRKDSTPVPEARTDPDTILVEGTYNGPTDTGFCSLGLGGQMVLKFDSGLGSTLIIREVTGGSGTYPVEKADVFARKNLGPWIWVGEVRNDGDPDTPGGIYYTTTITLDGPYKYIKIVDTTDPAVHTDHIADGVDVDFVTGS